MGHGFFKSMQGGTAGASYGGQGGFIIPANLNLPFNSVYGSYNMEPNSNMGLFLGSGGGDEKTKGGGFIYISATKDLWLDCEISASGLPRPENIP